MVKGEESIQVVAHLLVSYWRAKINKFEEAKGKILLGEISYVR